MLFIKELRHVWRLDQLNFSRQRVRDVSKNNLCIRKFKSKVGGLISLFSIIAIVAFSLYQLSELESYGKLYQIRENVQLVQRRDGIIAESQLAFENYTN